MTYIVMETHLSYSVVLDEAGRFLKVANMNHEVGQTLEQVVPLEVPEKKAVPVRMISVIGAVAACLVLMLTMYWRSYLAPFASVYLSINPEVRMEVSRQDTVVGLEGVNEDGVTLIAGYGFRGKSLAQVTDDLVDIAIEMGFLSDGGMVTVKLDAPDEAWFADTGTALRQNLNDHLSERMNVTVEVKRYSPDSAAGSDPERTSSAPATSPPSARPPASGDSGYGDSGNDSGYGDSGYGDSGSDSGYGGQITPTSSSPAPQQTGSNDSGYGDSAYNTPVPSADDGDSGYSEPEPGDDSDDSGYQEPTPDDGDDGDDAGDGSDSGYGDTDDDG